MKRAEYILIVICCLILTGCSQKRTEVFSRDIFAMDTFMNLKIYSDSGDRSLRQAEDRILEIESQLSVTNENSDINRINNAGGNTVRVCDDTLLIIKEALKMHNESCGALDITIYPVLYAWGFTAQNYRIPDEAELRDLLAFTGADKIQISDNSVCIPEKFMLDTGALTKGYTSDCIINIFKENGISSAIVNLGGNVQTLGKKPDDSLWSIAVADPFSPSENLGILKAENQAVITSGNYERYFTGEDGRRYWHIIDPSTGKPAENGLVSVTVISESGMRCDALSTALFIEGTEKAIEHWKNAGDFEMICVTDTGRILLTEGIADRFDNISNMTQEVVRHD